MTAKQGLAIQQERRNLLKSSRAEAGADENSSCLELLELCGNFNHRISGGDHIVDLR